MNLKMKYNAKVQNGKLQIVEASDFLKRNEGREFEIEIKARTRTMPQNNAMWLYATEMSQELNDRGLYVKEIIQVDIPWNKDRFVDLMWKRVMTALFGHTSTTRQKVHEVTQVYGLVNKAISDVTHGEVSLNFPCEAELVKLINKQ